MSHEALGEQFAKMRRIPVEKVGFQPPLPPRHDPGAVMEPAEGTRQPPGVKKVIGALWTGAVRPQPVDPRTTPIRATQDRLTPGSLRKSLENPQRRGRGGGSDRDHPVLYREGDEHYALDGHHRIASAMLRGEQFNAVVLGPEHHGLAQQYHEATEHVRAAWNQRSGEIKPAPGMRMYGRPDDPTVDREAQARRNREFHSFYPPGSEYRPGYANRIRAELRLPPVNRMKT